MKNQKRIFWITGLVLAVLAGTAALFPAVYYLNDDVTMRSILSGAYTGEPDGHAVYMKYPLTGAISLLYRAAGGAPWFSLTMAGCIALSAAAVLNRSVSMAVLAGKTWVTERSAARESIWLRALPVCAAALLCGALYLPHFLYSHYTVTAAITGSAALFLAATEKWAYDGGIAGLLRKSILPVLLLTICYCVRSQVFFLLLPFLGAALLWRALDGGLRGELVFAALLTVCILVCAAWNGFCYRDEGWRSYLAYNESRTELYDYADILPYEEHGEAYGEMGVSEAVWKLMKRYNLALEPESDGAALDQMAAYYRSCRDGAISGKERLKACVTDYYYYLRYTDSPYNILLIAAYALLAAVLLYRKCGRGLLLLLCLGAGRSSVWLYLIWRGRFPERVRISLYLIELLLLAGMLFTSVLENREKRSPRYAGEGAAGALSGSRPGFVRPASVLVFAAVCALLGGVMVRQMSGSVESAREQERKQAAWETLAAYCRERPENQYILDVYSMTPYAGMQYGELAARENFFLAGGWMTGSPLLLGRLAQMGASDGGEALIKGDNVYFVASEREDLGWLEDYLTGRFGACRLALQDTVSCAGGERFAVYRVRPAAPAAD